MSATAKGSDVSRKASLSDPGPENKVLLRANPSSNNPPSTDRGNPGPLWYSFDLAPKRVEAGGWTHQVTQRELPSSTDLAGVNMRLTAGSFRELHWHKANEWAIMLTGKARVSLLQADGKMFIDDVEAGDLWYFPAGLPHSIQGLGDDGCEFLLVFDQGDFSEDDTFLVSEFLAYTSPELVKKNTGWSRETIDKLPKKELYIFDSTPPASLADDKRFLGEHLETKNRYTFKMAAMKPTLSSPGGDARVVDRQLPDLHRHRRRDGHHQAGRNARDALASQCKRMAVLDQGQGTNDCGHHGRNGSNSRFQRQRCRLRAEHGRALHREYRQRGFRLSRDVQVAPVPGYLSERMDCAHARRNGPGTFEAANFGRARGSQTKLGLLPK